MRVTVIATGFDQKPSAIKAAAEGAASAPKADDNNDMDDDIFALFKR